MTKHARTHTHTLGTIYGWIKYLFGKIDCMQTFYYLFLQILKKKHFYIRKHNNNNSLKKKFKTLIKIFGPERFCFFYGWATDNKYIYSVFIFQAEIKRMREANKAASRERQLLLQQREEINRLRQSTKQVKGENQQVLVLWKKSLHICVIVKRKSCHHFRLYHQ